MNERKWLYCLLECQCEVAENRPWGWPDSYLDSVHTFELFRPFLALEPHLPPIGGIGYGQESCIELFFHFFFYFHRHFQFHSSQLLFDRRTFWFERQSMLHYVGI